MSELKYLSDGRKVSVIGKINKTEYIVQEIFVTENGDEIPSGENFTAKSLHDAPVASWKQREAEKYDRLYEKRKQEASDIEKEIRHLKSKRQAHALLLKGNEKFLEMFSNYDSDFIANVLTGNIKYVVQDSYSSIKIQTFEDSIFSYDNYWSDKRFEGIRMLSVFGINKEGNIKFKLSEYCDGSGADREVKFFKDDNSLKEYLAEEVDRLYQENKLTLTTLQDIKEWYEPDQTIIDKLKAEQIEHHKKIYEAELKRAEETLNKRLKELNNE